MESCKLLLMAAVHGFVHHQTNLFNEEEDEMGDQEGEEEEQQQQPLDAISIFEDAVCCFVTCGIR